MQRGGRGLSSAPVIGRGGRRPQWSGQHAGNPKITPRASWAFLCSAPCWGTMHRRPHDTAAQTAQSLPWYGPSVHGPSALPSPLQSSRGGGLDAAGAPRAKHSCGAGETAPACSPLGQTGGKAADRATIVRLAAEGDSSAVPFCYASLPSR